MDRYSLLWFWLMGLAGVLIVAGLAMLGVNLVSSARTGPRWKRKLVAAGLILLGIGVPLRQWLNNEKDQHETSIECRFGGSLLRMCCTG